MSVDFPQPLASEISPKFCPSCFRNYFLDSSSSCRTVECICGVVLHKLFILFCFQHLNAPRIGHYLSICFLSFRCSDLHAMGDSHIPSQCRQFGHAIWAPQASNEEGVILLLSSYEVFLHIAIIQEISKSAATASGCWLCYYVDVGHSDPVPPV
ncbi:hypothetical protein U9M48_032723 [Paspalum notatum var. saurae]|uniref:Uncharacterized protein n=1 Tax=Paspalum notatum var. saurae TaxID=547442 RepID=A0AAQ3U5M6_PASNO